jgi:hypothetical protein
MSNNKTNFFFKIVLTFLLGATCSVGYLLQDPRCRASVQEKMTLLFERDFGLHFTGTVSSISLWKSSVTFEEVTLHSLAGTDGWSIKVKECTFIFSFLRYLVAHKIGVTVALTELAVFSEVENQHLLLVDVLKKIFSKPGSVPLQLDSCTCAQAALHLHEKSREIDFTSVSALKIERKKDFYQGELTFKQGSLRYRRKELMTGLAGAVTMHFSGRPPFVIASDLSCALPLFFQEGERCHLVGTWEGVVGSFSCFTNGPSLQPTTVLLELKENSELQVEASGSVALATCMYGIKFPYPAHVSGNCVFEVKGVVGQSFNGSVTLHENKLAGWSIELLKTSFQWTKQACKGSLVYSQKNEQLVGEWVWDPSSQQVRFLITNPTPFSLFATQWYLPEKQTTLKGALSLSLEGTVKYQLSCVQRKTERLCKSHGTIRCKGSDFIAKGAVLAGDSLYYLEAANAPFSLTIRDEKKEQGVPVIKINHEKTGTTAVVELSCVQSLLRDYAGISFLGEGLLLVQGLWRGSELQGTIELKEGMVRVPSVYNFIHAIQARFSCNFLKRILSFEQVKISLQKGTIESALLQIGYDPLAKGLWAHFPLVFTDCFINWQKDLYLLFSGALIAKKIPDTRFAVEGFVVVDRSQLKENIFSQKTQRLLLGSWSTPGAEKKIDARISLATRSPLAVKTDYLETNAFLALVLKSGGDQAEVEGTITLQGGALHFPAHSLSIIKGKLIFTPEQPQDPFIELTAQARVKKYLVTLSVGGSAQDPHVVFDSIPSLSEEQIMMLLLAGSEEESLNIVVPALIMRSVENVIFGSSYRSRNDSWLEPLKRIKFVPRFTDQTGRGGFKGALEIEVSKRLRAIIEKNFSLTEDVAFEVEYLVTDDVSVRASYDERGDVGAEVEMRFKF